MRFFFFVMFLVLVVAFLGFVVTNLDARVTVHLLGKTYEDVSLHVVVFVSLLAGIAWTAVLAMVEGARVRLENRRLQKEIRRLEEQLREDLTGPAPKPPAPAAPPTREPEPSPLPPRRGDDAAPADDDDMYSGGSAV